MSRTEYVCKLPDWIARGRSEVTRLTNLAGGAEVGACLRYAIGTAWHITKLGGRAAIQGGAAFLRCTPDENVDQEYFGYGFDATDAIFDLVLKRNQMPEYHAWVAITQAPPGEEPLTGPLFVDFSAKHFPEAAYKYEKKNWRFRLPGLVGGPPEEMQTFTTWYESNAHCSAMVAVLARNVIFGRLLRNSLITTDELLKLLDACGGPGLIRFRMGGEQVPDVGCYATTPEKAWDASQAMLRKSPDLWNMPRQSGIGPLKLRSGGRSYVRES